MAKVGPEMLVNEYVYGDQVKPSVDILSDGDVLITWSSDTQDGSGYGIYKNRFDFTGTTNDAIVGTVESEFVSGTDFADIMNAGGGNDLLKGNAGNDTLYGESGNDIIEGGTGSDIMSGGAGDDTYRVNLGDGSDTINNQDDGTGSDTLELGAGIETHDVWFKQDGYDLNVEILEDGTEVTFKNWFISDNQKVDSIVLDGGNTLDTNNVNQLINAMASFDPDTFGAVNALSDLPDNVQAAITANWT